MVERGEEISQRTGMKSPWAQTIVWGWTVGAGGGLRGKNWDNCNTINKYKYIRL